MVKAKGTAFPLRLFAYEEVKGVASERGVAMNTVINEFVESGLTGEVERLRRENEELRRKIVEVAMSVREVAR